MIDDIMYDMKPYVKGLRFINDAIPLVDVSFDESWEIIPSDRFLYKKSKKDGTYYMIYSEAEGVGFDDIVEYIKSIIKFNIEKEEKKTLYDKKIVELTSLFNESSLSELDSLEFKIDKYEVKETEEIDSTNQSSS